MSEPTPQKIHVVYANSGYSGATFIGAFAVKAHADAARRQANIDEQRIPGSMGAFRVQTLDVRKGKA